jgi:glycosyltransferase involved in cell wall biosynthesis
MVAAGYDVIGWGSGWPCEIVGSSLDDLPHFYEMIDYYVDTSSDEGGCTPALECMALGIPVISHTVGVDRPVIPYERHSWVSLRQVLRHLTQPVTYDDWAREHAIYFREVLG